MKLRILILLLILNGCTGSSSSEQETFVRDEPLLNHVEVGTYVCTKCGSQIFHSHQKVKTEGRWPEFQGSVPGSLRKSVYSVGVSKRWKFLCSHCGLHVGHACLNGDLGAFSEGREPWAVCALSSSLKFKPKKLGD